MPKGGKEDRMQHHVYDSCMHKYNNDKRCTDMSYAVVNKYKQKHNKKSDVIKRIDLTTGKEITVN